jgi:nucleoside-diphosphate-sugar epimerase
MRARNKYVDNVFMGEDVEIVDEEGCASVHVDEVVDAFLLATLNDKAHGHVFNLSSPTTYISHWELFQFIIQLTGSKSGIKEIPLRQRISCIPESIEKIQRTRALKG